MLAALQRCAELSLWTCNNYRAPHDVYASDRSSPFFLCIVCGENDESHTYFSTAAAPLLIVGAMLCIASETARTSEVQSRPSNQTYRPYSVRQRAIAAPQPYLTFALREFGLDQFIRTHSVIIRVGYDECVNRRSDSVAACRFSYRHNTNDWASGRRSADSRIAV